MVTWAKVGIFRPKVPIASMNEDVEPSTVAATLSNVKWKQTMEEEFTALNKNNI